MSNILNLKTGEPFDPLPRLHHRPESSLAVSSSVNSARARGMLLGAKSFYIGGKIPYDQELDWLEGTGTQWIDTGVVPVNGMTFDTVVESTIVPYNCIYWGCRQSGSFVSSGQQCYLSSNTQDSRDLYACIRLITLSAESPNNWGTNIRPVVGNTYNLHGITINSTLVSFTRSIYLFGLNNIGSAVSSVGKCRIGSFVAYAENGDKVADIIPVVNDGVGMMYNKIGGELLENKGSGLFVMP